MLESKIREEAEQKSKVFLREVMGDDVFKEFAKNGKVEINVYHIQLQVPLKNIFH